MTPQELKNSILQRAIEGKLVEQRPEEGTGEELYQQIQKEKQKLIKEGKIKKEKPLPEITEDEKPFDIPESWKWVRLGDIAIKIVDGTHNSPVNTMTGDYKYVTAKNIKDKGIDLADITYVSSEIHESIYSRCNPEYGDILLIKDGATTGVVTINNLHEQFSMLSSVALIKLPEEVYAKYLVYVMRSDILYKLLRRQMKGTGITRITLKQIISLNIPLPPLAEQKRIVAKIEELMPLLDRYTEAWTRLEDFNTRFPDDMKKSILQQAIEGRLSTTQETEAVSKSIKRMTISEDDIPFDIPANWTWTNLSLLTSDETLNDGNWVLSSDISATGEVNLIQLGNIGRCKYIHKNLKHLTYQHFNEMGCRQIYPGYLLVNRLIGDEMLACIVPDIDGILITAVDVCWIAPQDKIYDLKYLLYLLATPYMQKAAKSYGRGTTRFRISKTNLINIPVPFPPLAEQHRIVAKIEELLPLCDSLKPESN